MQLPEPAQLVERQVITGEMQQRVLQHRPMAIREHETIAFGPVRIGGVVPQVARPQRNGDLRHPHRHAGMARFRRLDGVHRECANGIREIDVAYFNTLVLREELGSIELVDPLTDEVVYFLRPAMLH